MATIIHKELETDLLQSFLFDDTDVRGQIVQIEDSYKEMLERGKYPDVLSTLLGEALAATVLLAGTLKIPGQLSLQLQGNHAINLMVVQVTNEQKLRGMIDWNEDLLNEELKKSKTPSFRDFVAKDSNLTITIEPDKGTRYQGVVELFGDTLSSCLENYFVKSEQLSTTFILSSSLEKAGGIMLQKMPKAKDKTEEQEKLEWSHLNILTKSTKKKELLDISPMDLIHRLFHAEKTRLFTPKAIFFTCKCSKERCENMVVALGSPDIVDIIENEKKLIITCEFCKQNYNFDVVDLGFLEKKAKLKEAQLN